MDKAFIVANAIENIDAKFIEQAAKRQKRTVPADFKGRKVVFIAASAALAAIVLGSAVAIYRFAHSSTTAVMPFEDHLMALKKLKGEIDTAMVISYVPIGDRLPVYELIYMSQSEIRDDGFAENEPVEYDTVKYENEEKLKDYLGNYLVSFRGDWYQVSGRDDLRYLIRENGESSFSIWEFVEFKTTSFCSDDDEDVIELNPIIGGYQYGEVLSEIYHIHSAEDIVSIEFCPSNDDRTPEGIAYRNSIDNVVVRDRDTVAMIYEILSKMERIPAADQLEHVYPNRAANTGLEHSNPLSAVFVREIVIQLNNGLTIDQLKYSAKWGAFYDRKGSFYMELDDRDYDLISKIANIHVEADEKAFEVNKGLNCSEEFQRNQTTATRAYTCLLNCYRCSEENKSYAEDHSDSYSVDGIFSGGFPCYFGGSYINFYGQLVVELTEETGNRPIEEIEAEVKRLSGTDCVLFRTVKHAYSELVDVMTALCLHCKSSEYDAEKLQIYGFEICDEENTVIAYVNSLEEAILESTRKSVGHTDCLKFALQETPES